MLLLTDLGVVEVGVAKGVGVDLVDSGSKDDLINLLTRVILSINPSSDVDKVEVLLVLYDELFC